MVRRTGPPAVHVLQTASPPPHRCTFQRVHTASVPSPPHVTSLMLQAKRTPQLVPSSVRFAWSCKPQGSGDGTSAPVLLAPHTFHFRTTISFLLYTRRVHSAVLHAPHASKKRSGGEERTSQMVPSPCFAPRFTCPYASLLHQRCWSHPCSAMDQRNQVVGRRNEMVGNTTNKARMHLFLTIFPLAERISLPPVYSMTLRPSGVPFGGAVEFFYRIFFFTSSIP